MWRLSFCMFFFFFQAEDGIRDYKVTGVQTCALPISLLEDWTRQLAALFPTPWFNVGFDEQWELSRAKRTLGNSVDPSRVYITQLKRSAELLHQLGKRPMFLANPCGGSREFSQHPELIAELPA